jgi:predicted GH43/DUF377 family glycosyl hydrolase
LKVKKNFKIKKIKKSVKSVKKIIAKKVITKKKVKITKTKKKIKKKVVSKTVNKEKPKSNILKRYVGNPVIHPARNTYWESTATFNPTAFIHDGKIHVVYRAVGINDISTLGYARSKDGYNFLGRTFKPIFIHKNETRDLGDPMFYSSGGGWNGGAEDPRITKIDDVLYLIYTAFNGWGSVRIGLTSISLEDFLNKKWNWKKPVLISPPGEINKNWVIFPEKIKGKFAILHSFYPKILIDYFDSLDEFDGKKFIKSNNTRPIDKNRKWDSWFRGVGPVPIKTKYGWLVIYHAMDHTNPDRYRMGALLLDLKDPTKVLFRSKEPILEPETFYENDGHKWGVIYSCGAVVKGKDLFVYYGGADMVSCVATANLELFLKDLMSSGITKLKKGKSKK